MNESADLFIAFNN